MWIARPFASLAQLVEHVICNLGVVGSSPTRGSLTRLVLETTYTVDEQIAKLSSLLVFCTQIKRPQETIATVSQEAATTRAVIIPHPWLGKFNAGLLQYFRADYISKRHCIGEK